MSCGAGGIALLSTSLVPSPTQGAHCHGLPEHLNTLISGPHHYFHLFILFTVLFKTVSSVKPGTCQGFHLGIDSFLYPTGYIVLV